MYHSIEVNPKKREYYVVSASDFYEQMQLLASKYQVKSIFQIKKNGSGVLVTFDDGYQNNLSVAVPILDKFQIPYVIFISTEKIGTEEAGKKYLSVSDIAKLAKNPLCTIGSHGHSHKPLAELSQGELILELQKSKQILQKITGMETLSISYPHGSYNAKVIKAVSNTGFTHGACSDFGGNLDNFNLLKLKRIDVWGYDDINTFKGKIEGGWDWIAIKESIFPLVLLYRFLMKNIKS